MKKRSFASSLLLISLMWSTIHAASYTTETTVSSQGFTVTARANWNYENGTYLSRANHTVDKKPGGWISISHLRYLNTHIESSYRVKQFFEPSYHNVLFNTWTYGDSFSATLRSIGPRSLK